MASKTGAQSKLSFDWLKWVFSIALLIMGLVANYYYNSQPWPLRLLAWIILLIIIFGIILQTYQGKKALSFAQESNIELRKVFWPARHDVMQTTLVVAAMVISLSLILWGIDSILMWLIGWLTGQRG